MELIVRQGRLREGFPIVDVRHVSNKDSRTRDPEMKRTALSSLFLLKGN